MIQLAWRLLWYQPHCALAHWYRERAGADRSAREGLIVALARKQLSGRAAALASTTGQSMVCARRYDA